MKLLVIISILAILYTGIQSVLEDQHTYCQHYYISSEDRDIKVEFIDYNKMTQDRSVDASTKKELKKNNHFRLTIRTKEKLMNDSKLIDSNNIWDIKKNIKLKNDKGEFRVNLFIPESAMGENIQTFLISFKKSNMGGSQPDVFILEQADKNKNNLEIELTNNCQ